MSFFNKIIAWFLSILAFFGINLGGNETDAYNKYADIAYGAGKYEVMDIYVPSSAEKRDYNGAFLFLHGGSWTSGDKADLENSGYLSLLDDGYILVFMNYTLYNTATDFGKVTAFTLRDEVGTAIAKLKEFSDEKGLNITKLCTSGVSAGGHISLLYTYTQAKSSPIEIVFTANRVAPADFSLENWSSVYGDVFTAGLLSELVGQVVSVEQMKNGEADELIASVSPARLLNSDCVPSIAGYGLQDTVVPTGNASAMKKALEESGIEYTYIEYPNSNHLLQQDADSTAKYDKAVKDYALRYFGY